jgi:tRNA threonylcarbamoyladenosine modification (KEOPS) complex  Pcc1 subunit
VKSSTLAAPRIESPTLIVVNETGSENLSVNELTLSSFVTAEAETILGATVSSTVISLRNEGTFSPFTVSNLTPVTRYSAFCSRADESVRITVFPSSEISAEVIVTLASVADFVTLKLAATTVSFLRALLNFTSTCLRLIALTQKFTNLTYNSSLKLVCLLYLKIYINFSRYSVTQFKMNAYIPLVIIKGIFRKLKNSY